MRLTGAHQSFGAAPASHTRTNTQACGGATSTKRQADAAPPAPAKPQPTRASASPRVGTLQHGCGLKGAIRRTPTGGRRDSPRILPGRTCQSRDLSVARRPNAHAPAPIPSTPPRPCDADTCKKRSTGGSPTHTHHTDINNPTPHHHPTPPRRASTVNAACRGPKYSRARAGAPDTKKEGAGRVRLSAFAFSRPLSPQNGCFIRFGHREARKWPKSK